MKIAAIQMLSGMDIHQNMKRAEILIEQAAAGGAQLVLLPEYFCLMGAKDSDKLLIAETDGAGPIQDHLASFAQKNSIWLIGGTVPLKNPDPHKVWNSTLVFNPQGKRMARYDKIHLFSFSTENPSRKENYNEALTISPGTQPVVVECGLLKVGLSICYDLRFPELYRSMAYLPGGMDLIVVPAAFTYITGKAHWELLLRARAVENQCYVLAAAQGGLHANGRHTWGHSMLVNPWGEIISQAPSEGEAVLMGQVELETIRTIRLSLPALSHRVLY
mgnify:CR=1 FL=1